MKKKNSKTIRHGMDNETARQQFVRTASADETLINNFLSVAERVRATRRSFGFQDFFRDSQAFEIGYSKLQELFERWVSVEIAACRLEELEGLDGKIYIILK